MTTWLWLWYWSHAVLSVCCWAGQLPSRSPPAETGPSFRPCVSSPPSNDISLTLSLSLSASEQARPTTNIDQSELQLSLQLSLSASEQARPTTNIDQSELQLSLQLSLSSSEQARPTTNIDQSKLQLSLSLSTSEQARPTTHRDQSELQLSLNDFVSNPMEIAPERRDDVSSLNSLLVSADVMTTSLSSDIDWNPSTTVYNSVNVPITDSITLEDHQLGGSQPYLDYFDPDFLEHSSPLFENESYGIHDTALVGLEACEPHLQDHHPDFLQQNNQLLDKNDTVFHDDDLPSSTASVSDISSKKRKRPSAKWDNLAYQILSEFPLSDQQRLKIKDIENSKSSVLRQSGKDPFPSSDLCLFHLTERLSPQDVPLMAAIYNIYFRLSLPPLIEPCSSHTNRLQQALRRMLEWYRNNCPQNLEEFHQLHPHMSLTYFLRKNYGLKRQKLDQSAVAISNSDSDSALFCQQTRSLIASKGTSITLTGIRLPIAEQICTYVIREYPLTEEQIKVLDQVKSSPSYARRLQGEDPFSNEKRLLSGLTKRFLPQDLPLVCAIHQLFFGPDLPIPKLCEKTRFFEQSVWAMLFCFTVHREASLEKFQQRRFTLPIARFHKQCCRPGSDTCGILEFHQAAVKLSNEELDHIDELCRRTVARFPRSQQHIDIMKEVEKSEATQLRDQGLDPFKDSPFSLLHKSKKKFTLDDIPLVADLFQHFFGRDIQYRVRLVERTSNFRKSLQAILICFWDHWNGDSEDFRRIHSKFSILYFSKYSCRGSKKCSAQELAVRYSDILAQNRHRQREIKQEKPCQAPNSNQ